MPGHFPGTDEPPGCAPCAAPEAERTAHRARGQVAAAGAPGSPAEREGPRAPGRYAPTAGARGRPRKAASGRPRGPRRARRRQKGATFGCSELRSRRHVPHVRRVPPRPPVPRVTPGSPAGVAPRGQARAGPRPGGREEPRGEATLPPLRRRHPERLAFSCTEGWRAFRARGS